MHMVFGLTSLTLLITTIWMLAVDHYRPWKQVQRRGNNLETRQIEARIVEQENTEFKKENIALHAKRDDALRQTPAAAPVVRLKLSCSIRRSSKASRIKFKIWLRLTKHPEAQRRLARKPHGSTEKIAAAG